jgi:hypothetical protein
MALRGIPTSGRLLQLVQNSTRKELRSGIEKNIQSHFGLACFAGVLPHTYFGKEIKWNRVRFAPYPLLVVAVFVQKAA